MSDLNQAGKDQPPDVPVHGRLLGASGGVELEAENVNISGDVVARDKIVGGDEVRGDKQVFEVEPGGVVVAKGGLLANIRLPRSVQIAIGVATLALVVLMVRALIPANTKVNTEFIFDASSAMADPERWRIAQTVFGDQATYATRREQLALRKVGGGCDVPADPLVPLGANQADRLVSAVKGLTPAGDAALVDSVKAAADDMPSDAEAQNTIILVSAGEDTCLAQQQKDPCAAMSAAADGLKRAGIKFTLHIVALRANEAARQQLACLAQANATGYVYQANSVEDLKNVLSQIDKPVTPVQTADSWPLAHTLEIPRNAYGLGWSSDGKQVLVNTDDQVLSWDLESNRVITSPVDSYLMTGVWSPDGKQIAYIGGAGIIYIWSGTPAAVLKSDLSGSYRLVWSPDGQHIASGSLDGAVGIWDMAGKTSRRLSGHSGAVFDVAWSPDGKQVASGGQDGTVRLWDAANGQLLQVLTGNSGGIAGLAWSPDSRQLASNDGGLDLHIWEAATGQLAATISTDNRTGPIRWSPDGAYIATRNFEILDVRNRQSLGTLVDYGREGVFASSFAWSPDGVQLAVGLVKPQTDGNHYFVRVWKVPRALH